MNISFNKPLSLCSWMTLLDKIPAFLLEDSLEEDSSVEDDSMVFSSFTTISLGWYLYKQMTAPVDIAPRYLSVSACSVLSDTNPPPSKLQKSWIDTVIFLDVMCGTIHDIPSW